MSRHPEIIVPLSGEDGNIFFIIARVSLALKKAHVPQEEIHLFFVEMQTATDYNAALQIVMNWVETT